MLRCVRDGVLGCYTDWKIDDSPSRQLLERVLGGATWQSPPGGKGQETHRDPPGEANDRQLVVRSHTTMVLRSWL